MKTFRRFVVITALMIGVCVIPCLLPAEIPENGSQIERCAPLRAQKHDNVVDISACQNACRMRYGPTPPTGFGVAPDPVTETEKGLGAPVEQSNPVMLSQCMEDCERNYWKQFDEDTKGSKRGR